MTERASNGGAQVSFLLWIAEVDAVIAEVVRIGFARGERELALDLRHELRLASELAQDRLLARKAFHFIPSAAVADLARIAIQSARRRPQASLGDLSGDKDPTA